MQQIVAKVIKGELKYNDALLTEFLKSNEGKSVLITFERYGSTKTMRQLGYYFASVVHEAAKYFGWLDEDMHEWLKSECNKKQIVNVNTGRISYISGTTSKLPKYEYAAFVDRCIIRLAQEGYVVRTPDEYFAQLENQMQDEIPTDGLS